ncbi:hypothetical protein KGQ27_03975 [Patescibacteria group bacterium]|nr:hypothetical protein [Patescibacteria group bacterium]MDE2011276.1 hypothetical protein [Patescibacteria group bacterium]MDE2233762.1 hypothetical protein [Patescibacteria group bacterium]
MNAPLTKGMYGHEFHPTSEQFGLSCGQMRGEQIVHNGGWYNKAGEKLGWGDLGPRDFLRVSNEMDDGDLFIVLPEQASFWNFVTRPGIVGGMSAVKPDVNAPGVDYVAENARYIITRHQCYLVDECGFCKDKDIVLHHGVAFKPLTKEAAKKFIAEGVAVQA